MTPAAKDAADYPIYPKETNPACGTVTVNENFSAAFDRLSGGGTNLSIRSFADS
jgi:hypothetical protein